MFTEKVKMVLVFVYLGIWLAGAFYGLHFIKEIRNAPRLNSVDIFTGASNHE